MHLESVPPLWSLACRYRLGCADWRDAEKVGLDLLLSGVDSDGIVALASVTSRTEDLSSVIDGALIEREVEPPDDLRAGRLVARDIAQAIDTEELDPYPGARRLWQLARNVPELEPALWSFIGLASEWEDAPECRRELEGDIRREARELLTSIQ